MSDDIPSFDPLDDTIGRGGVPRDQYDRALLVPPGGGARVPYTSMSTLAKVLGSDHAIHRWQLRMTAKGVGMSRELAALAGSSRYDTRIGETDEARNREEGAILDDCVNRAQFLAGAHQKRDWGSAFHRYVETEDPLGEPPVEMAVDIEAFRRRLRLLGIRILDTEVFVVNEELGAAGSFDYLFFVPWRDLLVIGDSKTGVLHLDQDEIQLFGYAGSEIYDRDTDERYTFAEKYGMDVDQELAYTVHTAAESGETELYPLDLVEGRKSALLARDVHRRNAEARKRYGKKACRPLDAEKIALQLATEQIAELRADPTLNASELAGALRRIHDTFREVWTPELTTAGRALISERRTLAGAA